MVTTLCLECVLRQCSLVTGFTHTTTQNGYCLLMTANLVLAYGAFVLLGGLIGFIASGSAVSLITGGLSGVLAIVAGVGLQRAQSWGWGLGVAVSALVGAFFVFRFVQTSSIFPALITAVLSVVVLVVLLRSRPSQVAGS
jgi:uncharacterized membrane protein (UPF0136 family)